MSATIFPNSDLFTPEYKSERQFFNAVKELNSSWTGLFNSKKGIGKEESDCILIHKTYGVFSVEVKGGKRFRIKDGQWERSREVLNQLQIHYSKLKTTEELQFVC